MKEKFLNHFRKIGPRRFVIGTVILMVVLDILNIIYFKLFWIQTNMSHKILLQQLSLRQIQISDMAPPTLIEVTKLIDKAFAFVLFIILVNNLFFYFFYFRKKLWAQGFVLFYTLTAVIFSIATLFMGPILGPAWFAFTLLNIPIYLYLFLGVKLLKAETTLVPEKKAR